MQPGLAVALGVEVVFSFPAANFDIGVKAGLGAN